MTPEQQRIAIHEACGWTGEYGSMLYDGMSIPWSMWTRGEEKVGGDRMPDYLNDLNACHEMEKVLTDQQYAVYKDYITDLNAPRHPISATAAQRAEAFLKTLNLWTP